jgi:hypothetical protein
VISDLHLSKLEGGVSDEGSCLQGLAQTSLRRECGFGGYVRNRPDRTKSPAKDV